MSAPETPLQLSIVMPCLNEARTVGLCVKKAAGFLSAQGLRGEVIVADNGSTDGSQDIAAAAGARVVPVARKGYGAALMGGVEAARGAWVIMGDADDSYDFSNLGGFLEPLRAGADVVMGNRFRGGIAPGAMPPLHRYFGTPLLSALSRFFFRVPVGDVQCGLRAFRRQGVLDLRLRTTGMEWASEMLLKSALAGRRFAEIPITLHKDGRGRPPHLRTWRDGWRNLRFYLLYSPGWVFWFPALVMVAFGALLLAALAGGPRQFRGLVLDIHTYFYGAVFVTAGAQAFLFGVFAKIYAFQEGLIPSEKWLGRVGRWLTPESGLALGLVLLAAGLTGSVIAVLDWRATGYGNLDPARTLRFIIPSGMAILLGTQTVFTGFFLGLLAMRKDRPPSGDGSPFL